MNYASARGRQACWGAADLGPPFVRLGLAVDTFARELIRAGGKSQPAIAAAMSNTVHCYWFEFDLCHLAKNIANTASLPPSLRAAAQDVIDAYGYPPTEGKPLVNSWAVDGSITANETWATGPVSELRGTKIGQMRYGLHPPTDPPDVAGRPRYGPFVANNAWHWFLEGNTSLPAEPLVTYDSDTLGDLVPADGLAHAFSVTLRNSGGAGASGILAGLRTTDPYVTITQGTSAFSDIGSEATAAALTDFSITIDPAAPDEHRIWFCLDVTADGGAYANTTSFCTDVPAPATSSLLALGGLAVLRRRR